MAHDVGVLCGDATHRALGVVAGNPDVLEVVAACGFEASKLSAVRAPQDASLIRDGHLLVVVWWGESHVPAQEGRATFLGGLDLHVELDAGLHVMLELLDDPAIFAYPQHSPARMGASHAVVHRGHCVPPLVCTYIDITSSHAGTGFATNLQRRDTMSSNGKPTNAVGAVPSTDVRSIMEGLEFLRFVWGQQQDPDAQFWMAVRTEDGSFVEVECNAAMDSVKGFDMVMQSPALYFCPNPFDGRRRRENCRDTRWLYQDLDEVRPDDCPIFPDVWWETSPGRYQAMWALENHIDRHNFVVLNKALNRACGADKGTWNLTRYLRVPGSWSGKRQARVGRAHVDSLVPA